MFKSNNEEIFQLAIDAIKDSTRSSEGDFIELVVRFIRRLDNSGGLLLKNGDNRQSVRRIDDLLQQYLERSGYTRSINRFLRNFDKVETEVQRQHRRVNNIRVPKGLLSPFQKSAITRVTSDLVGRGLDAALKDPVRELLFDTVTAGGGLRDLITQVTGLIKSTNNRQGQLLRHVTQISRDALQQYNGRIHNAIRNEFDLRSFLYVNSLVLDSRAQCKRWHRMEIIDFKDLRSEIRWANRNGSGMIPNTTPDTFYKNRGGFACRHEAIPTNNS